MLAIHQTKKIIAHMDAWNTRTHKRFMPTLKRYFHYRNLDVSTLKILAQMWAPQIYDKLEKEPEHTALQDIRDSITELKFYREHILKI